MRKYKKKKVKNIIKVLDEVQCNFCGKKYKIKNDDLGEFVPVTEFIIFFGYGSRFDTERLRLDICDDCVENLVKNLKIKPKDFYGLSK